MTRVGLGIRTSRPQRRLFWAQCRAQRQDRDRSVARRPPPFATPRLGYLAISTRASFWLFSMTVVVSMAILFAIRRKKNSGCQIQLKTD